MYSTYVGRDTHVTATARPRLTSLSTPKSVTLTKKLKKTAVNE